MALSKPHNLQFKIPGYEIPAIRSAGDHGGFKVEETRSFRLSATARASGTTTKLEDVSPDDVFELVLDDGTRLWTSSRRFIDEVGKLQRSREGGDTWEIPAELALRNASRGLVGKVVIKVLSWLRIDVAAGAAAMLAQRWENKLLSTDTGGKSGLYWVSPGAQFKLEALADQDRSVAIDKPVLLFLHGTGSSTRGSFGELWQRSHDQLRDALLAPYLGAVLTLEHRTLTESPVENAIQVVEALPRGAQLHLISHSRGGLIGELLCRGGMINGRAPFDDDDYALFKAAGVPQQQAELETLNSLLREKQLRVHRFVRVACPARGTTLASERLDIYLSLILNLFESLPFLPIATDVLAELIMVIAQQRANPAVLPGLEAQIPGSPLVRVLNRPDREVTGDLGVISGDIEGEGTLSAISTLLTDPLYRGDHDLVVDTPSMYGGAARSGRSAGAFHRGPDVNHFRYFKNDNSAALLQRALSRTDAEEDGFTPFDVREVTDDAPPYRREDSKPRPIVFLLPGIMGSHLSVGADRIWMDIKDLAFGGLSRLGIAEGAVQAGPPMASGYNRLITRLAQTHDVEPFPYDWRLSIDRAAQRLAERIGERTDYAEQHGLPISLLAHSMGGLVARAMIAAEPQLWQRLGQHPESRLIMLGTPSNGSHAMARVLLGRDSLIKKLAFLDVRNSQAEILDIIRRFPGVLELLPGSGTVDLWDAESWKSLADIEPQPAWTAPTLTSLRSAKKTRDALTECIDPKRMIYIAGQAPATPMDLRIDTDPDGNARLRFDATPEGDGRVPWATGLLPGVPTWYMPAVHGDMANHEPAFEALRELLSRGKTSLLRDIPPIIRGVPDQFEYPEERSPLFPTEAELTRAALGGGQPAPLARDYPKARIRLCHGNLSYARYPVLAGHYAGDSLVSAEAHLDRVLEGRLGARINLGLYPGTSNSEEVFLNAAGQTPGAIIIGLGQVGELSPGELKRAVARGVRKYALAVQEADAGHASEDAAKVGHSHARGITALLVGSGAGGMSVDECISQILRGVADANRALTDSADYRDAWIREVEFIELYEDIAIRAGHVLRRIRGDYDIADFFDIDPLLQVVSCAGGRRRASFFKDDPWWQRLQITSDSRGQLTFNKLTDKARSELSLLPTQRAVVDAFIDDATATTNTEDRVAVTLFNMLLPNELKAQAPDRRSRVLILDERTAEFPWELLREPGRAELAPTGRSPKPMAVEAGMIRQLGTEAFRARPARPLGKSALVIGNPITTTFSNLQGAETEAASVAEALQDKGFQVSCLLGGEHRDARINAIPASAKEILHALYQSDYRILHLAGHGVFKYPRDGQPAGPGGTGLENEGDVISGMVIGDGQFLTPSLIEQMTVVPDLVFINCCHLGNTEREANAWGSNRPSRLAANLATQLIRMGVRVVVAAGWAVDDRAAETFANTFYNRLLTGANFGDATLAARVACYNTHPGVNTWGAYQCYGDPGFTLDGVDTLRADSAAAHSYSSRTEYLIELANIAEDGHTATSEHLKVMQARLQNLTDYLPANWKHNDAVVNGDLAAAFGRAYGELWLFEQAIRWYENALITDDAGLPVRAVEQLCNLQSRHAASALAADGANRQELLQVIDQAGKRLTGLIEHLGITRERRGLLGSIAKRRAILAQDLAETRKSLTAMQQAYCYDSVAQPGSAADISPYTLFNSLSAEVLLGLLRKTVAKPEHFDTTNKLIQDTAAERDRENPDFWLRVVQADCVLLEYLAGGQMDATGIAEVTHEFVSVRNRGASPLQFRSVLEQLQFYRGVLAKAPSKKVSVELVAALTKVHGSLEE